MRWNVPLGLTLGRVAVIPAVLALFYVHWPYARQVAAMFYLAACVTDWLDGWLARRWKQETKFGAFLDPVADKLLVAVSLVMLLHDDPKPLLAGMVAVIIGREITVSALREWMAELGRRGKVSVGWPGKLKTGFQMTAIGFMIWKIPTFGVPWYALGYGLLVVASGLTLYSMFVYLRAAWPELLRA